MNKNIEERSIYGPKYTIEINKYHDNTKRILDIGGGGEGIISQIYGNQVVAIDTRIDELNEFESDSLKIVMDASEMNFTDKSFDIVTIFYSLMYMNTKTKKKVFIECQRVLKDNGVIEIWDCDLNSNDLEKDIYITDLEIKLPSKTITTNYGTLITDREHKLNDFIEMAQTHKFDIEYKKYENGNFYLKLRKQN